jgi:ribosomal 30S subunit maturation factor RimM
MINIQIGANASRRNDRQLGYISNVYHEGAKTILVIENDYEVEVHPGEVEEVVDLTRGLRWYRLLQH